MFIIGLYPNREIIMNNKIAQLESQVDHLEAELTYLNTLLTRIGFDEGIITLKAAAEEVLRETAL